jgi:succinate dehydrogenase / fumarate reductase membrane anchor subunit
MAIRARTFRDARAQARSNPELAWWVFMRLSGTFLVVLTLFHLFNNYITTSELSWDYEKTAVAYASVWERLYLMALLGLGILHGLNGMRYGIDDATARNPRLRVWLKYGLYTVAIAILVFGLLPLIVRPGIPGVDQ